MGTDCAEIVARLRRPTGPVDVVIDTDTYNEIDDQYALAYLIHSSDRLNLKAVYAAPFLNSKVLTPRQGMELSYKEIHKVLSVMDKDELQAIVHPGSDSFMQSEEAPVMSDASRHLSQLAMQYTKEEPLYVIGIAAITDVASALLMNPEIKDRIVVVWLGGNAHDWPENREFNLHQDIAAARVVFASGVPLVQLPCSGVVSSFTTCRQELEYWLRGKNRLCDYLLDITISEAEKYNRYACWTRKIWDVTAVAWLLSEEFMLDRLVPSPIPEYDGHYAVDPTRHFIRYVYHINRDALFADLFRKLGQSSEGEECCLVHSNHRG